MPREQPGPATGHHGGNARSAARHRSSAVRHWIATAPGTYVWLGALFVTTVVLHRMPPAFEDDFLRQRSTDLRELSQTPVRALTYGALWIDGGRWLPYAALFTVFHATAEHWLGTLRWLTVAAAAHVLAILVVAGVLAWAVRHGHAPASSTNTLDDGVGYALAGVVAVLTYRVPHPWRYLYAFAVLVFYGVPLVADGRTFTDLGHVTAVLTGLACYPLTRTTSTTHTTHTTRKRPAQKTKRPAGQ
ncbi:rhomboid-like protein [Streptomyces sp. NPDC007346]|uniref:rhomboid-like protein n=1 Tax=Streptomyces sp. NPDC007346 TaxID=3154682 RepID=UPI003454B08F